MISAAERKAATDRLTKKSDYKEILKAKYDAVEAEKVAATRVVASKKMSGAEADAFFARIQAPKKIYEKAPEKKKVPASQSLAPPSYDRT